MSEIRRSLASLVTGQQNTSDKLEQENILDRLEQVHVMFQISGLMARKHLRWTRSTASDGDARPANESFKSVLMEKYFPGAPPSDIECMVVGKCAMP